MLLGDLIQDRIGIAFVALTWPEPGLSQRACHRDCTHHTTAVTIAVPAAVPMPRTTDTSATCLSLRHLLLRPAMLFSSVVLLRASVASGRRFAAVERTQRTNSGVNAGRNGCPGLVKRTADMAAMMSTCRPD